MKLNIIPRRHGGRGEKGRRRRRSGESEGAHHEHYIDKEHQGLLVQGSPLRWGPSHQADAGVRQKIVGWRDPGEVGLPGGGVPVFNTRRGGDEATGPTHRHLRPPAFAADAICEDRLGARRLVCITEGIPILDMVKVKRFMEGKKTRLWPELPRRHHPGVQDRHHARVHPQSPGRSASSPSRNPDYEAVHQVSVLGMGQSTCWDRRRPINGTNFIDVSPPSKADPKTERSS